MENITSRKNSYIRHLKALCADGAYRREAREFVCDGLKMLNEAAAFEGEITSVLWRKKPDEGYEALSEQHCAPDGLFEYVSPLVNSPGPVFTVRMPERAARQIKNAIVLESVQDPGNVGTVVRTAAAFDIDAVVLTGGCADIYNPKTVRSTMGAIFRQYVLETDDMTGFLKESGLQLYGAALSDRAEDIRNAGVKNAAVAIGSEGRGLSARLLSLCEKTVIIPMTENSESLNAAVAASVVMWEMAR
jgi:TrmH family RNA methyltransferase